MSVPSLALTACTTDVRRAARWRRAASLGTVWRIAGCATVPHLEQMIEPIQRPLALPDLGPPRSSPRVPRRRARAARAGKHPRNTLNELSGDEWLFFTKSVLSTAYPSDFGHRLRKAHGANKPPQLMQDLIEFFTPAGGRVLDPFAGVGGTLIGGAIADPPGSAWGSRSAPAGWRSTVRSSRPAPAPCPCTPSWKGTAWSCCRTGSASRTRASTSSAPTRRTTCT